jgi:hypothetical protein
MPCGRPGSSLGVTMPASRRSRLLPALALAASCVLGCRQWAAPAPAPATVDAAALAPRGARVSLRFEGGLREHYQLLPLLEAHGMVASFEVPERTLGTPGHMTRLQLGLVEEAGHRVLLQQAPGTPGDSQEDAVTLDDGTPLSRLAEAVTRAEAQGGGQVRVTVRGLANGQGFETLAHFLAWLAPRAQAGTHVRLAAR